MWLNQFISNACNLLWLSSEQIIKILILQKEIDKYSEDSSDLTELHDKLNEQGMKLGHNVEKLIKKLNEDYPDLEISNFEEPLKKLQEFFYRRYVVHSGSSIPVLMIDQIDEFYFLLRNKIHADVGLGTIDEIYIQKKHGWVHPLPAFSYAYFLNKHFTPRKHREINLRGPDGNSYRESGE